MTLSESIPPELAELEPGLTYLDTADPRTGALHGMVELSLTAEPTGEILWVDARNSATTYAFADATIQHRVLSGIQVARAFTAYQHHSLIHQLVEHIDEQTTLVVTPCLGALYADDDVPDVEAAMLFADIIDTLDRLAEEHAIPILVTATTTPFVNEVVTRVDRTITITQTDLGLAFETDTFQTTVYHGPGYWQTTIPYWVDLFGHIDPAVEAMWEPQPSLATLG